MGKKVLFFGLVLFALDGLIFFFLSFFVPRQDSIDVGNFLGRMYHAEQVKPDTFSLEIPFEEALFWGENAILAYSSAGVEIWRPDPETPGVFQHAQKMFDLRFYQARPYIGNWQTGTQSLLMIKYGMDWDCFQNTLVICVLLFLIYALWISIKW